MSDLQGELNTAYDDADNELIATVVGTASSNRSSGREINAILEAVVQNGQLRLVTV